MIGNIYLFFFKKRTHLVINLKIKCINTCLIVDCTVYISLNKVWMRFTRIKTYLKVQKKLSYVLIYYSLRYIYVDGEYAEKSCSCDV